MSESIKTLKVYVAGKVSPDSSFGREHWRERFCKEISDKSGIKIINVDPLGDNPENPMDQTDAQLVYGRCAKMIDMCDVVIVHLTDDISVGGSQEMLIAKLLKKPLIALAPYGGKFYKIEKEFMGKTYNNYKDPFVLTCCDYFCTTTSEVAKALSPALSGNPKSITFIRDAVEHYHKTYYQSDDYVKNLES